MNILLTGANGQLGSELRALLPKHPEHTFFCVGRNDLNLTDPQCVYQYLDEHKIQGIINCAAYTNVDKAEAEASECRTANEKIPYTLALSATRLGIWMIHFSTDYVFNGKSYIPYVEQDTPKPRITYGVSKLKGEGFVTKICPRAMIIRTSWLYSTYGNNFVKNMLRLGRERSELGVVFDQIGTPTYAADLAETVFKVVEIGVKPGIFHYANEGVCSWYDFAHAIHHIAGITCKLKPLHTSEYHTIALRPYFTVLDKTKIKTEYGITIPHWRDSLEVCLNNLASQNI